jgi:hypothetical protein
VELKLCEHPGDWELVWMMCSAADQASASEMLRYAKD